MSDETKRALDRFALASKRLAGAGGKSAGGFEGDYATAYQVLVKLGLRRQLRRKYRQR